MGYNVHNKLRLREYEKRVGTNIIVCIQRLYNYFFILVKTTELNAEIVKADGSYHITSRHIHS
jgi:hypothetical protein